MSAETHEILPNEIVIELDSPKNDDIYFFPIADKLRSAVVPDRSGGTKPPSFIGIFRIPGHRIHVDVSVRKGRITDGLGSADNKRILEDVKRASAADQQKFFMPFGDPAAPRSVSLPAEDDVETWLYWMSRIVEAKQGTVVQGNLEPSVTIRNRGRVKLPVADARVARSEFGPGVKYYKPEEAAQADEGLLSSQPRRGNSSKS